MKTVFAFGEESETIFFAEFAQANRTICSIFEAADSAIQEHGERVDEGLVDARVMQLEEVL
jgi:hypothetical protein